MVGNHLNRTIATESFDYGNHTIKIKIKLKYTNHYSDLDADIMNNGDGFDRYHYYRFVYAAAVHPTEGKEVDNKSAAAVDVDDSPKVATLPLIGEIQIEPSNFIPSIPEQVEYTVRPVFEELDKIYQYTDSDTEIEVDVAVDRVEHEMSWVEVDDEIERISKEIDSIAEVDDA